MSHPDCNITIEGVGRHPNAYLDASLRYKHYNKALSKAEKGGQKGESKMDEEAVPQNINNLTEPVN